MLHNCFQNYGERSNIKYWRPRLTFQRHSALLMTGSEVSQFWFCAIHYLKVSRQLWFSCEQRWKRNISQLKIREQRWFCSETALSSVDFWRTQNNNFCFFFPIFVTKILKSSFLRNLILIIIPFGEKKFLTKILFCNFLRVQRYNKYSKFWVFWYWSSSKTDTVHFLKNVFPFFEINVWD